MAEFGIRDAEDLDAVYMHCGQVEFRLERAIHIADDSEPEKGAYFNNDIGGDAPRDARRLRRMIAARSTDRSLTRGTLRR